MSDEPASRSNFRFELPPVMWRAAAAAFKAIWGKQMGGSAVVAAGQSHLDAAWRWRAAQTHEKAYNTFRHALKHLKRFPDFTFSQSQPVYYQWMKDEHPDVFAAITRRVAEGRWELTGGMWVEPDCNLSGPESLVRQRLYGQRFYLEHFGRLAEIEWLPDTFGFCWTLPQILAKSGAKAFWTTKMNWNAENRFPVDAFWWQSPDGSRVATLLTPLYMMGVPATGMDKLRPIPLLKEGRRLSLDYATAAAPFDEHFSHQHIPATLMAYGFGDGGAGPLEDEILAVQGYEKEGLVRQGVAQGVFDALREAGDRLPVWNDELYLEFHQGCFTTQTAIKRHNRQLETALLQTETLCLLSALCGGGEQSDQPHEGWRTHLFQQFHDILPGSGIVEVVQDAVADYENTRQNLEKWQCASLANLPGAAAGGENLLLVNTLGFSREGVVVLSPALIPGLLAQGQRGASQVVATPRGDRVAVFTGQLPPLGWLAMPATALPTAPQPVEVEETPQAITLENDLLRVVVDRRTGWLDSLRFLPDGPESLASPANRLLLYREDPWPFPAWNLDTAYPQKALFVEENAEEVTVTAAGPLMAQVRVHRTVAGAAVTQVITVTAGCPWVDLRLETEWVKKKMLLKAAFPFAGSASHFHSDIPFGVLQRPVYPVSPHHRAQWERPLQRWVDLSTPDHGLALLADGPGGFSMNGAEIRLSLLRSPRFPSPWLGAKDLLPRRNRPQFTDLGPHQFHYALLPHAGDWRQADLCRRAVDFATPVLTATAGAEASHWRSLLSMEGQGVLASAVKPPQDPPGPGQRQVVLRLAESHGEKTEAVLQCHWPGTAITAAEETDLLELSPALLPHTAGGPLTVALSPWEIKTLRLTLGNAS